MIVFFMHLESLKDNSRSAQMEKMSIEDSLSRLQVLKSLDEAQLQKLKVEIDQVLELVIVQ